MGGNKRNRSEALQEILSSITEEERMEAKTRMKFAEELFEYMKRNKISVSDASRISGISEGTIKCLLNGDRIYDQ